MISSISEADSWGRKEADMTEWLNWTEKSNWHNHKECEWKLIKITLETSLILSTKIERIWIFYDLAMIQLLDS